MIDVLHAGALVPAGVGACCALTAGSARRGVGGASAALMLLAMADMAFGLLRVAPVAWAALMLVAALAAAATARWARGAGGGDDAPQRRMERVMTLHSSAGLIVMAGLVLAGMGSASATSGAHTHPGASILPLAVAAGAGYALVSWVMGARALAGPAAHLRRSAGVVNGIELASMGTATAFMAVAVL